MQNVMSKKFIREQKLKMVKDLLTYIEQLLQQTPEKRKEILDAMRYAVESGDDSGLAEITGIK